MTGLTAGGFVSLTAFQAEGCGGGFAAIFIRKGRGWRRGLCRRVVKGKVLKMDGPSAQGFLGLTGPLAPRVADCRSAAMLIKSALRDLLLVSYGKITILVISRCAAPPYPAAPDFLHGKACHTILRSLCSLTNRVPLPPHPGDRINRSMLS